MQILLGNSMKPIFLLIIAIILYSYTSYTTAQVRVLSHNEEIDYNGVLPRVWDSQAYDDGTMIIRIIRKNATSSFNNYLCFYETLSLRIINLDGTATEKDLNLDVQAFNYCVFQTTPGSFLEFMKYYLFRKNQLFITYYNATDLNNPLSYVEWGMVVDYDGNVLNRSPIGLPFIDNELRLAVPSAIIQLNINREKGFMRVIKNQNNNIDWKQFRIEPNGTITKLTFGKIDFYFGSSIPFVPINTVGEDYAIAFGNNTRDPNVTNPLLPRSQLFILPIGYNQNSSLPLLLYQTTAPNLVLNSLFCDVASDGIGQTCILTALQGDTTGNVPSKRYFIKINFLPYGSVSSLQVTDSLLPVVTENNSWIIDNLILGGYLLTTIRPSGPNQFSCYGFIFDENISNPINWGFPEPVPIVVDLPRFDGNRDKVELSDGKLSIYQLTDQPYLRQHIFKSSCTISNDGRTVNAKLLDSTFSVSNGIYYVTMDSNFVVNEAYKQPILGIKDNVWRFNIEQKKAPYAPSMNGLFRLTPDGTSYFDSLSPKQRSDFFNTLLNDISNAVPVSPSRLTSNNKTQLDLSVNKKQYLISIGVKETSADDLSVAAIVSNLDTLVKNKDQTPISNGPVSQYLDETYGFVPAPNLWEKYKNELLDVFLISGLLIGLFLFARYKNKTGNNIAILQLGLIISDLVLDIAFVTSSAKEVSVLYIPSVVFVAIPIGINIILAFYIIAQENKEEKFYKWFMDHRKVASVFTVLAGADIEVLNVLHSKLAGFSFFNAPFSDKAKSRIFWGACLNILTEDISQVIIQV
ncbi:hypothetical protein RclHR1_00140019 [Rhizophagus clarus]|uniref:Uncharacterized protein n=1 Tax=Rhizophagus clarus TaxID=94130 RepID=A0A2Z6QDA6_9GLOM|nr:hypothetical protein RclHR1_00140019 [Rhizophagus clarus]